MSPRGVSPISLDQLKALPTPRLLAYRDRLLALEESYELSDWTQVNRKEADPDRLYFKADPRWQRLYAELKAILAGRQHVDRTRGQGGGK